MSQLAMRFGPIVGHEMIFASAGSGKTHALTTRFIRLLAAGVPPERIAALTFTRKAAGEFFAEIVNRLAAAAADAARAKALAADLEQRELNRRDFLRLLRVMVRAMHRLNLGTLDGFFAQVVRSFPLELGLAGEPTVLDERAAAEEMRRVLGRLLSPRGDLAPEQKALVEAFKQATFGTEDKAVTDRLDAFIGQHLSLYRAAPEEAAWGAAPRIWPDGFPWGAPEDDPAPAAAAIRAWATRADLKEKQRQRWLNFADAAEAWAPGSPLPGPLTFVLRKALEAWDDVRAGCAELKFDQRPQRLDTTACAALTVLVRRVIALELGRRLAITQGIGAVLRAFDALYDAEVRRTGRLTFADLQQVLVPAASGARLSAGGALHEERLQLDYRLDARLDHWMFDEFQDTSFPQWQILENLVDEVMQDTSGERSFFYVGDVKQAIYAWREGDPRLFTYVADRYRNLPGGGVVPRELNDSWRSGPAVIAMVNRVCGNAAIIGELFPEAAPEWNRYWRDHRSARPERGGQAALLHAPDEAGRWAVTRRLLAEINPLERGLSCAVLVRTNETGAQLADYLRREGGLPAVAEADLHIGTDNPVATGLAALLQAAAHPDDTLAHGEVAMSPLAERLRAQGVDGADAISRAVLAEVQQLGFAGWMEAWGRRLEDALEPGDRFSRLRLQQLVVAAQAFDETGSREVDAFLRFLRDYTMREPEGAGVVRVMTVHKSKGLGFDVVVLPDLQGEKLAQRRRGPAVCKRRDRGIEWVLEYPGELVVAHDPVLRAYRDETLAENCYEQLSLLYVALTRAKSALYTIIEPRGESESLNFPRWLGATLGERPADLVVGEARFTGTWSEGDPQWFQRVPRRAAPPLVAPALPVVAAPPARAALPARRPSAEKAARLEAGELFGEAASAAAGFGRVVHQLLAQVEWLEAEASIAAWAARWQAEHRDQPEAVAEAVSCLRAPALADLWRRPSGQSELWRERAFELVHDGTWITGVLDRVVVTPAEAVIIDFKTDRVSPGADLAAAAQRHRGQMHVYRAAVARLTGLAEERVAADVIFTTRPARVAAR